MARRSAPDTCWEAFILLIIVLLANLVVGVLIGISGIAGFLLPITFSGFLGMPVPDALALSFLSFLVSGILGAWSYHRAGNLDWKLALPLCLGSFAGALVGVKLNLIIPADAAKILLYAVVLLSGVSVLLKKEKPGDGVKPRSALLGNPLSIALVGLVTAAICSLTGAGGPVLVVPLLALLGVDLRIAVGVALLDSAFIALPACVGYLSHTTMEGIPLLAACGAAAHAVGVLAGAKASGRVNLKLLRLIVGLLSVGAAVYMLVKQFFF